MVLVAAKVDVPNPPAPKLIPTELPIEFTVILPLYKFPGEL
jgi:hypothetical protein